MPGLILLVFVGWYIWLRQNPYLSGVLISFLADLKQNSPNIFQDCLLYQYLIPNFNGRGVIRLCENHSYLMGKSIIKRIVGRSIVFSIYFLLFTYNSHAQTFGCTDPLAVNFNPLAIQNDGSCIYNSSSVTPQLSVSLASNLSETSGLIKWNNQIWTHNDNNDINIYALDTINGEIIQAYSLKGTVNRDWEEISQDGDYIYIGDFGNNQNGNRKDLNILRINKNSVLLNSPIIDTIYFSYSDQNNFNPTGSNNSDFDCEALIVSSDSIFLFTKQWINKKTNLYSLSKTPGVHIAKFKSALDVQGLITGAVYLEPKKLIVLCGYSSLLEPFIYLLYDFNGSDYFDGNKRKIAISLPFHQMEGITTTNGLKYFLSNEYFALPPSFNILQKLHIFDLSSYLNEYFTTLAVTVPENESNYHIMIYPNPSTGRLTVEMNNDIFGELIINIFSQSGSKVLNIKSDKNTEHFSTQIDLSGQSKGMYIINLSIEKYFTTKKIVIE